MIELFGTAAVSAMALCYALEERGARWSLAFGGSCLLSAGYALAISSWPFAAVETLWAGLAVRRGLVRSARGARYAPHKED